MDKHKTADQDAAAWSALAETDADRWLDCALEDSFPASDPLASNRFD